MADNLTLPPARYKGRVKWYDKSKRFGFIVPDDVNVNQGGEVFVHITALKNAKIEQLQEGDLIEFEIEDFRGRSQAIRLVLL